MHVRPVTPGLLARELAEAINASGARRLRVAIDGAPGSGTGSVAASLVDPLRVLGRETVHVSTVDFLRPASLRFEHGRDDPDSYYGEWFDFGGLSREVLEPLAAGGSGEVLPALWDAATDRSPRKERIPLQGNGIVLVDGPLLLGAGLGFDVTIHLWLPGASLKRLLPDEQQWTLPAFERYATEIQPERHAGHVVRTDRPGRPAIVDRL